MNKVGLTREGLLDKKINENGNLAVTPKMLVIKKI